MKKITAIITTITLFVLQAILLYVFSIILKIMGLNISEMNSTNQNLIQILVYIIFMIAIFIFYRKSLINDFKDFKKNYKDYLKLGIKIWAISVILMIVSNIIIQLFYSSVSENEQIVSSSAKKFPLFMMFSSIIYAPFTEEIIYRKSIKNIFDNNIVYILVSGLAFGYVHTLASSNNLELLYIIPYGLVGSAFAYIYTKTKNIYTSITLHALHNTIVTITYFLPLIFK